MICISAQRAQRACQRPTCIGTETARTRYLFYSKRATYKPACLIVRLFTGSSCCPVGFQSLSLETSGDSGQPAVGATAFKVAEMGYSPQQLLLSPNHRLVL
jgi:hypothetical protein